LIIHFPAHARLGRVERIGSRAALAPEKIASELATIRALTDRPFGINLFVLPPVTPDEMTVRRERDRPGMESAFALNVRYLDCRSARSPDAMRAAYAIRRRCA
jgi:hypothetical protein